MKVLAIHGSPRIENSATDQVLLSFLEGAKTAGADTEIIYLAKQKINQCSGCFSCWLVHPGKCIHQDDMKDILAKFAETDFLVLATPVYIDGMTSLMKKMLERLMLTSLPFIEFRDGHSRHPARVKTDKKAGLLLISTCGFPEKDNFDPLINHVQAMIKNMHGFEYVGSLIRPTAPAMNEIMGTAPETIKTILDAFHQAGVESVTLGAPTNETQAKASAPLMTTEEFHNIANTLFASFIEQFSSGD